MKNATRIAIVLLVVAGTAGISLDVRAQFLGQQSLSQSSYVIDKNGHLFAFGWNWAGQLGVGDKIDRNTPVEVPIPPGATRWTLVAGGTAHALAVADSDKLYAWGSNRFGQLGTGTMGEVVVPTRVANPSGVTAWKWVTAGRDHSLALSSAGQLYTWGNNDDGQLGLGNHYMVTIPQLLQVIGVPAWAEVAAGPGYTLAVSAGPSVGAGGQLFGWGVDSMGNCFSTVPQAASPMRCRAPSPMLALNASNKRESSVLASGYYGNGASQDPLIQCFMCLQPQIASDADGGFHALIIQTDGVLRSIGANEHGQLGLGNTLPYLRPHHPPNSEQVAFPPGVTQFVAVAAGLYHSLALGNDGNLYVWGDNSKGELGLGADSGFRTWPARLMTIGDSIRMEAATLTGLYSGAPLPASVTVKNTASATPLSPAAMFVPCDPLIFDDTLQTKALAPAPLALGATGDVGWTIEGVQYLIDQVEYYFVYVRAPGSAPYLIGGKTYAYANPLNEWMTALVVDSLTGARLPGGVCNFIPWNGLFGGLPHDTVHVGDDAVLRLRFIKFGYYDAYLSRENYLTQYFGIDAPPEGDTIPEVRLGPSPVQGLFRNASDINSIDGMTKLYFPDSLIGFAIGHNIIWRTTDSGAHWNSIYVTASNSNLNDIRFANPRIGMAAGDGGEIFTTTNGGDTWAEEMAGTTNDLRALAYSCRDTAWAIGDAGTVLMRSLDSGGRAIWTALPSLGNDTLTAIHFLDATHGAIVANSRFYLYDGSTWKARFAASLGDLRAVCYVAPTHLYVAGANGLVADVLAGGLERTLSHETITGLSFLSALVGFAAGDSSGSLVTYDSGYTWAPLEELKSSAVAPSFYGVNGHLLGAGRPMTYTGHANSISGIVKGHVVSGDPSVPGNEAGIRGAIVDRRYSMKFGMIVDTLWTNELGNFVFAGIRDTFHYTYTIYYREGGVAKSYAWRDVSVKPGEIITLGFIDTVLVPQPPPDTQHAWVAQPAMPGRNALALSIEPAGGGTSAHAWLHAVVTLPREEQADLALFDVMGRRIRTLASGLFGAGQFELPIDRTNLSSGTYYVRLMTPEGERMERFPVTQ